MSRHGTAARHQEDRLDRVFAALADPTRRAVLRRLSRGPASVSELAAPFAMTLPAVSKHLRVLERAGLLRRERDGWYQRCYLEAHPLRSAGAFLQHYQPFWEQTLEQLAAYVEAPVPEPVQAPPRDDRALGRATRRRRER